MPLRMIFCGAHVLRYILPRNETPMCMINYRFMDNAGDLPAEQWSQYGVEFHAAYR
jgi:hypothetical protein